MVDVKTPLVVDMFSGEEFESCKTGTAADFAKVYASGIRGIIHKATQGTRYTDKECAKRIPLARAAGLLVGIYHFGTSAPVGDQVAHFLEVFEALGSPQDMLLALDFEKNEPEPSDSMNYVQARTFLKMVYERTGQRPALYSGNKIKEALPKAGDPFISQHRLWLCQYAPHAVLPPGFDRFWLWQYTGDGHGSLPHECPGIRTHGLDLNVYGGADLAAEWAPTDRKPASGAAVGAMSGAISPPPLAQSLVLQAADPPADEPIPYTPADLKAQGSGSMSAIDRLLVAVGLPTLGAMGISISDAFGYFKEGLDVLKTMAGDNPAVLRWILLGFGCVVVGLVLRARWRLLLAAREGRYQPQQPRG